MSEKVVSIFKYAPRDMGQCPGCKGYRVRFSVVQFKGVEPGTKAKVPGPVADDYHADWYCIECDGCF
jgi:hypothetical protein